MEHKKKGPPISKEAQDMILQDIKKAQEIRGNKDGSYVNDLFKNYGKQAPKDPSQRVPPNRILDILILQSQVYFNSDLSKVSAIPLEGYQTWNQYKETHLKGYLQERGDGLTIKDAPTFNFDQVVGLLKSTDLGSDEVKKFEEQTKDGNSLFLDGQSKVPQVLLTSYIRSGSTVVRHIFEKVTGIVTGANMKLNIRNLALVLHGLKGESTDDEKVWVVKTHHPITFPFPTNTQGNRIVVLVRNPLDVIVSCWHFFLTQTQNKTMANDFNQEFPEQWNAFVKQQSQIIAKFYDTWINAAESNKWPIYFLRCEDLANEPRKYATELLEFSLGLESAAGTVLEKRINERIPATPVAQESSHQFFNKEELDIVLTTNRRSLNFFGYSRLGSQPETPLNKAFHLNDASAEEEKSQNAYLAFNTQNKKASFEKNGEINDKKFSEKEIEGMIEDRELVDMEILMGIKELIRID